MADTSNPSIGEEWSLGLAGHLVLLTCWAPDSAREPVLKNMIENDRGRHPPGLTSDFSKHTHTCVHVPKLNTHTHTHTHISHKNKHLNVGFAEQWGFGLWVQLSLLAVWIFRSQSILFPNPQLSHSSNDGSKWTSWRLSCWSGTPWVLRMILSITTLPISSQSTYHFLNTNQSDQVLTPHGQLHFHSLTLLTSGCLCWNPTCHFRFSTPFFPKQRS